MKAYSNWQATLYKDETKRIKHFDVPLNEILEVDEENFGGLQEVSYKGVIGWMESKYIEPYINQLPINCVDLSDIETPDATDAAQYVLIDGVRQVNMCGEWCIAEILDIPGSAFIANWKEKDLPLYKRIFGLIKGGKARGTGAAELVELLEFCGVESSLLNLKKYNPNATVELLKTYHVIFSCSINGQTGALRSGNILHWCVLKKVFSDRQGMGWIQIYNPFFNCEEQYSWAEFVANTRNYPYGVMIPKDAV